MQNVRMEVNGTELIIRVDLTQTQGLSGSGKSVIVATTGGNVPVPGQEHIKLGLNVYRPNGNGRSLA